MTQSDMSAFERASRAMAPLLNPEPHPLQEQWSDAHSMSGEALHGRIEAEIVEAIATAREQGRHEGLEEAAKTADPLEEIYRPKRPTDYEKQAYDLRENIAYQIRALNPMSGWTHLTMGGVLRPMTSPDDALVERVAREIRDVIEIAHGGMAGAHGPLSLDYHVARAAIAVVLEEAAKVVYDLLPHESITDDGFTAGYDRATDEACAAIRALKPKERP